MTQHIDYLKGRYPVNDKRTPTEDLVAFLGDDVTITFQVDGLTGVSEVIFTLVKDIWSQDEQVVLSSNNGQQITLYEDTVEVKIKKEDLVGLPEGYYAFYLKGVFEDKTQTFIKDFLHLVI